MKHLIILAAKKIGRIFKENSLFLVKNLDLNLKIVWKILENKLELC